MNNENKSKWDELWSRFHTIKKMEREMEHSSEWQKKVIDELVTGLNTAAYNAYQTYYQLSVKLTELSPKMKVKMNNLFSYANLGTGKDHGDKPGLTIDLFINCTLPCAPFMPYEIGPCDPQNNCTCGIILNVEKDGNFERFRLRDYLEDHLEEFLAITGITPGTIEDRMETITDELEAGILGTWQKEVEKSEVLLDNRYKHYEQWVHSYQEADPEGAKAFQSSIPKDTPTPPIPKAPVFNKEILFGSNPSKEELEGEEEKEGDTKE